MRSLWLAVCLVLTALASPARADVRIIISKSQQQMAVSIDGASYRWPVSTGRAGYDTPNGYFHAIRLEEVYYSKKYDDAPMPNAVFFYGGYAIHGTLEEKNLGRAASHGCVRLSRANAATLFAAVRAQSLSRTRIEITDAPLDNAAPVASYERGPVRGDVVYSQRGGTRDPGFEQFDNRGYRNERSYQPAPIRRVFEERPAYAQPREIAPVGGRIALVPGRSYSEAEMRRIYQANGWRWDFR